MEGQVALLWVFIEMTSRFQNPDANQTNGNLSQSTSGYFVLRFPQTGEHQDRTERHTWFLTVPTSTQAAAFGPCQATICFVLRCF